MKQIIFLFIALFYGLSSLGQIHHNHEITPKAMEKIKNEINKQIPALKKQLLKKGLDNYQITFALDTFRIERTIHKRIDIDYTTIGMNVTVSRATKSYDKLMNKYYNKLLKMLEPDDKKVLISAQRAWLAFRDAEAKLIGIMGREKYSGGGTIQSNIAVGRYNGLVEKRTLQIFHYFHDAVINR